MRLSIKSKVSITISITVFLMLFLFMVINYVTTKEKLLYELEERMKVITQQITVTIRQSQNADEVVEQLLAEKLYHAATLAAKELPPDAASVTNKQLDKLSKKLGVTYISLLQYSSDQQDIIITRSSFEGNMGYSTARWGYWFTAFNQLLTDQQVTIPQGQKMKNFWAGPFDKSTSYPQHMDKWGYYYDGKRNYIINANIRDEPIFNTFYLTKPDQIVEQTLELQPTVLEVSAINPYKYNLNHVEITDNLYNSSAYSDDSMLLFGSYQYPMKEDIIQVRQAFNSGEPAFIEGTSQGKSIYKGFIPITEDGNRYVLCVAMDAGPLKGTLKEQFVQYVTIGLVLLQMVIIGSYILAGHFFKPIHHILEKVNMLSIGRFNTPLQVKRKDELGLLASRISLMGDNLYQSTERLRTMYEENRSMKDHLESFINQSTDAILVTDLEDRVQRINQAYVELFGWTEDEIKGKLNPAIPTNLSKERQEIEALLNSGAAGGALETVRITKAGRLIEVSVSRSPIIDESGKQSAWASITRDITNSKRMEELLRRSEKLTMVGQLAAGVAHEIRNPLTTLRGFIQLQERTGTVNPAHTSMMLSELDRINLIVSEFLVLSKPQAVQFQVRDMRQILSEVLSLLDSQAHMHGVSFQIDYEEDLPFVCCEENQMKQVFINVIKNAIEAMPNGGLIDFSIGLLNPNRVQVQIRDYGIGIPEENLSKIGDPFFTNKEKGTGLGLMVTQRIIYNHKGTFDIQSKENEGTIVTISLPAMDDTDGADHR